MGMHKVSRCCRNPRFISGYSSTYSNDIIRSFFPRGLRLRPHRRGLIAGICPCNSVLCLGLIGYLTSGKTDLTLAGILRLTVAFSLGTILVLLPLGVLAGYLGEYLFFLNETIAWAIGGVLMILMGLQLLHAYKPPIRRIFNFFRAPASYTVLGAFLLGLSFGAITIGRGAPMLLVVLTYIALYQTAIEGLLTVFVYAVGLSIPPHRDQLSRRCGRAEGQGEGADER